MIGQMRAGLNQMLAVIQHQQQVLIAQVANQQLQCCPVAGIVQSEYGCDVLGDLITMGQRGQLNQPDPIRIVA
jgi:hypothetical protein